MTSTIRTGSSWNGLKTVQACRDAFAEATSDRYQLIGPDPLMSDTFPTSFTSSAGPNLATAALLTHSGLQRWNRVAVVQPCLRYWDIETAGDGRHLSFFEMATMVSLGLDDRFQVVSDFLRLLTENLGIEMSCIWATVFDESNVQGMRFPRDADAEHFWQRLGISGDRISFVGGTEGFVANRQEAVGGYRTELYFEYRPRCDGGCEHCVPGQSQCGRFIEIGTSVSYAYAVDFNAVPPIRKVPEMPVHAAGFGVERVMQVLLGRNDIGMVDVIAMCRDKIGGMATHRLADAKTQRAATVAADHLRGLAFLANEGAPDLPGKENKGRRWIINRYAKSLRAACVDLGIEADALVLAVLPDITACYSQWYPLLRENEPLIGIRLIKLLQRNGGV